MQVRHLVVRHGRQLAVDDASLDLLGGEITVLQGANGAGKSSLLHALARPRGRGTVLVDGVDIRGLHRVARRRFVALVPEAFDDLLFTTTVAEECRRADRRVRTGIPSTAETFLRFLGMDDPEERRVLLTRHPRDLSAGERLCLVIAIQLSARPRALLVDEPTRGLDASARRLVGDALRAAAASGAAVLVATHDDDFADGYATRTVTMSGGRVDDPVEVSR